MECNWKCNSQHGMTSSCRFNWAPWTTNLFSLKSVFPEIRVRTWVQVVFCQNNKPLICWPIRSSNFRGLCFWQETTWTHVLTRISEKTDFSKLAETRERERESQLLECATLLLAAPQWKRGALSLSSSGLYTDCCFSVFNQFRWNSQHN